MIHLRTLGSVDLRRFDGEAVQSVLAQPKRLALLAYIAVSSTRGFIRRDQALALFWPEQDDEHARAALNRALYYLRHSLGNGVPLSRGDDELGLAAGELECDAVAFQTAVAEHRYQDAVQLYSGDLLEGFFVSGAPGFEKWLESERERLRTLAARAGWALADELQKAGNAAQATHWARWATERAPYDEVGLRRLMTMLDATGDRAGAVRAYEQFARHLASELELTPSPESLALAETIRLRERVAQTSIGVREAPSSESEPESTTPATPPATAEVPASGRRQTRRVAVAAAIAIALVITSLVVAAAGRTAVDPNLIVLVPFQNRTGVAALDEWARRATDQVAASLSDYAQTERASPSTGIVRVELAAPDEGDLRAIARRRRAGTTIVGSISQDGDDARLHARLLHVSLGGSSRSFDTARVWPVPPLSTRLDDAAMRELQQRVAGGIAVLRTPHLASWFPLTTPPPTLAAFEEYREAGRVLGLRQYEAAAAHYEQAAELDPSFTVALLEAATVHRRGLKSPGVADSILRLLNRERSAMPTLQQHWLDLETTRFKDATEHYRYLKYAAALAPGRFLGELADAARLAHRPGESIELLERLGRNQRGRSGVAAGHWVLIAPAYHELGEYRRELDAATRARRAMPDRMSPLFHEIRARAALNDPARVLALLDTVLSLPEQQFTSAGSAMILAAEELRAHGHPEALEAARRALSWYRARPPDEAANSVYRYELASALEYVGCWTRDEQERQLHLAAADALLRVLFQEDPAGAWYEGQRGVVAVCQGDRVGALAILGAMEQRLESAGKRDGDNLYAQAMIKGALGDADGALAQLRNWIGGQGWDLHAAYEFEPIKHDTQFREFLRPKG